MCYAYRLTEEVMRAVCWWWSLRSTSLFFHILRNKSTKMRILLCHQKTSNTEFLAKLDALRRVDDRTFQPVPTLHPHAPNFNTTHASRTPIYPKCSAHSCHFEYFWLFFTGYHGYFAISIFCPRYDLQRLSKVLCTNNMREWQNLWHRK